MLKNLNIYFGSSDLKDLCDQLKYFINTLINQLNSCFPIFEKIIQEQILYVPTEKGPKALKYKIGRKISENTPKYTNFGNCSFEIQTPEIFRVLIKWV